MSDRRSVAAAWRQFERDGSTVSHMRRVLYPDRCAVCGNDSEESPCRECAARHRQREQAREARGRAQQRRRLSVLFWAFRRTTAALAVSALLWMGFSPALAAPPVHLDVQNRQGADFLLSAASVIQGRMGSAVLAVEGASYAVAADGAALTSTVTVGADTLVARVPWAGGDGAVSINGVEVALGPSTVQALALRGVSPESFPEANALAELAGELSDPAGFAQGVSALGLTLQKAATPPQEPSASGSCFWPCANCALALLAYGLTMSALIAACAPTAGGGCIAALLYHFGASAAVVLECSQCAICLASVPAGGETVESIPAMRGR